MIIYPAIDIKEGKCVRLKQGRLEDSIIYGNPVDIAKKREREGFNRLHIVDLDGAIAGSTKNLDTIVQIIDNISIPVQVGGGIRNIKTVDNLISAGVDRIVLGTVAVNNFDLLRNIVGKYGERIVISIDAKDGMVALDGWVSISKIDSIDLAERLQDVGVKTIVYTDISRDGMLVGPNIEIYRRLKDSVNINIIASGGIKGKEDIEALQSIGIYGCIVGKALFENQISYEFLIAMEVE